MGLIKVNEIKGTIYCTCAACMSVLSDFLSWANSNLDRMVKDPSIADNIVVLSCQVTDLAIRNDLNILNKLIVKHPSKKFFVGGCLAQRTDIELPMDVYRLDHAREDYTEIQDKSLVNFENPFWIKNKLDESDPLAPGMLFRNMYPLRIGVGCNGKCVYCTIKHTRGGAYNLETNKLIEEFKNHDDVVLIADSPNAKQLTEWIDIALELNKPISIRNVEPTVVAAIWQDLINLADANLLKILHCPVQSCDPDILNYMKRDGGNTIWFIENTYELRKRNVIVATNIIVDIEQFNLSSSLESQLSYLTRYFDYISWNPMWNGIYKQKMAEERYLKYLGSK